MIKTILLTFLSLLFISSSFAVEREVVLRNKRDKLVVEKVELKELTSDSHYIGKSFKLVHKTSNEPIQIDDSSVSKKAANVYYHLTKAKNFFAKIGKKQTEQITIRIDIENAFHKKYHFQNVRVNPVFNNASTIARGAGVEEYNIAPWGEEIWFRPAKKIKIDKEFKKKFRKLARNTIPRGVSLSTDILLFTAIEAGISGDIVGSLESSGKVFLQNYLTSSLLRYAVPELMLLFSKKNFHFNSAFIPEVIYHEYTHYAMADSVSPIINNTVLEGFADFFAAKISGRTKLADKLGDYGALIASRSALSKGHYFLKIDTEDGLGNDFVLSLLYELSVMLAEKENERFALKALFEMRKAITLDTKIAYNFPNIFWEYLPKYKLDAMMILNLRGI
jgi:hypothetical protein